MSKRLCYFDAHCEQMKRVLAAIHNDLNKKKVKERKHKVITPYKGSWAESVSNKGVK